MTELIDTGGSGMAEDDKGIDKVDTRVWRRRSNGNLIATRPPDSEWDGYQEFPPDIIRRCCSPEDFHPTLPDDAELLVSVSEVVTPESLELHAEWMDEHQGVVGGAVIAEGLKAEAKRLRADGESAAARWQVLADLKPGLYELRTKASSCKVIVTPEGRLFAFADQGTETWDWTKDYIGTADPRICLKDSATFTVLFEGGMTKVKVIK